MSIQLNHTIALARDPLTSATSLAEILGCKAPYPFGPFQVVALDNGVTLDFLQAVDSIPYQHYAFLVSEEEFDVIFSRIRQRELPYWAGPDHYKPGEINHHDRGRGVYWDSPEGHTLEIITRQYEHERNY